MVAIVEHAGTEATLNWMAARPVDREFWIQYALRLMDQFHDGPDQWRFDRVHARVALRMGSTYGDLCGCDWPAVAAVFVGAAFESYLQTTEVAGR